MACRREVKVGSSTPAMASAFLPCRSGSNPGSGLRRQYLCADVHGGRWAVEKQQNRDRDGGRGGGESAMISVVITAKFSVAEGRLTVMKSDKDALAVGETASRPICQRGG